MVQKNINEIEYVGYGQHTSYDDCIDYFRILILSELENIDIKVWVAGGAMRDFFQLGYVTTDIDLYFPSEYDYEKTKGWILDEKNRYKRNSISQPENYEFSKIIYENQNSCKIQYKNYYFDLVKHHKKSPAETISNFDFTICAAACNYHSIFFWPTFFLDLSSKSLTIKNYHNPISTFKRLQKYIKKGFTIHNFELLELAKRIKDTPSAEINPVEFQLDQLENPHGILRVKKYPIKNPQLENDNGYDSGNAGTSGMASTAGFAIGFTAAQRHYDRQIEYPVEAGEMIQAPVQEPNVEAPQEAPEIIIEEPIVLRNPFAMEWDAHIARARANQPPAPVQRNWKQKVAHFWENVSDALFSGGYS